MNDFFAVYDKTGIFAKGQYPCSYRWSDIGRSENRKTSPGTAGEYFYNTIYGKNKLIIALWGACLLGSGAYAQEQIPARGYSLIVESAQNRLLESGRQLEDTRIRTGLSGHVRCFLAYADDRKEPASAGLYGQ